MKTYGSDGQALLGDGVNAVRTNLSITTLHSALGLPTGRGVCHGKVLFLSLPVPNLVLTSQGLNLEQTLVGLKLVIFPPQPLECWAQRRVPVCPASVLFL